MLRACSVGCFGDYNGSVVVLLCRIMLFDCSVDRCLLINKWINSLKRTQTLRGKQVVCRNHQSYFVYNEGQVLKTCCYSVLVVLYKILETNFALTFDVLQNHLYFSLDVILLFK